VKGAFAFYDSEMPLTGKARKKARLAGADYSHPQPEEFLTPARSWASSKPITLL
jgi:hypothetical protein